MIFLLYTGTSALIICIFNIQRTQKYRVVMYVCTTIKPAGPMWSPAGALIASNLITTTLPIVPHYCPSCDQCCWLSQTAESTFQTSWNWTGLGKRSIEKKNVFFRALPEWGGGGLPTPEFCGPLFRSAFLVNEKSLFLQTSQELRMLSRSLSVY